MRYCRNTIHGILRTSERATASGRQAIACITDEAGELCLSDVVCLLDTIGACDVLGNGGASRSNLRDDLHQVCDTEGADRALNTGQKLGDTKLVGRSAVLGVSIENENGNLISAHSFKQTACLTVGYACCTTLMTWELSDDEKPVAESSVLHPVVILVTTADTITKNISISELSTGS